jgi:hypothetical protein
MILERYRFHLMKIEFEFTPTPELGNKALRYLLWRRGGPVGPIALILFPVVLAIVAADPRIRPVAYVAGGAAIMLFVIFLLAVAQRRRMRRRFFETTTDHNVKVSIDDGGMAVNTAVGSSTLPWTALNRIWAGKEVVLIFYHGWHYLAFPSGAVPAGAIEFISARIQDGCSRRR